MPVSLEQLRAASARPRQTVAKSITEARAIGIKTAFLCHSHLDAVYVRGIVNLLRESGWTVYVDWEDASMPPAPDRDTARKIKSRIEVANYFLFLATPNSVVSRWCPWEIGFADGKKPSESIFIIPTRDSAGTYYGNEYLQLYQRIDVAADGELGTWSPGKTTEGRYVKAL